MPGKSLTLLSLLLLLGSALFVQRGAADEHQSASHPTEVEAYAEARTTAAMVQFIFDAMDTQAADALTTCKARTTKFQELCPSDHSCREEDGGEKENSICCSYGDRECARDEDGEEYDSTAYGPCCEDCVGSAAPSYCTNSPSSLGVKIQVGEEERVDGFVSVCGSKGANCGECTGIREGGDVPDEKDDYDTLAERCEDEYGRCVKDDEETYHSSSESCTNDGGNWVPAQWVPKPDYVTEKTCTALGTGSFCRTCSIGRANSPTACTYGGICSGPQGCSDLSSEHDCTQNTNCTFTNGAAVNAEGDFSSEDACRDDGARCEQCSHSEGSSYYDCLNRGTCSVQGKSSRGSCEGKGDCFKASDGSLKESDVSEFECNRGACFNSTGHVVNSDADSSSECDIASGETYKANNWTSYTWTPATVTVDEDATDEDACEEGQGRWWSRKNWWEKKFTWDRGTAYPGPPMVNYNSDGTCKTGKVCGECNEYVPSGEFVIGGGAGSLLGEHVMANGFVTDTTFLKDVKEGKTYAEAVEAEGGRAYYKALQPWLFTMSNINVVDVDVEGVTKQKVSFATSGLNILANVKNMGTFSTEACGSSAGQLACPDGLDADDLHLVVLSPENFDTEGGSISIPTGKFTVLGGTNAGKISVTTTDAVRIFGIENSGEATFENSDDLYVSSMPNSGKVLFKNTHGVFLDIVNEADAEVTFEGGSVTAYGIVNQGKITIKSGTDISGHVKCNKGGEIFIEEGVTVSGDATIGSADCVGTISGPGAEKIVAKATKDWVMKQSLTFEGAGVTKAAFDTEEKKAAIAESIAIQLGVGPTSVKIIQITDLSGRRSRRRNLASTGIVVDYEVTVSDESLKDLAKTKMDTMTTGSSNATLTRITEAVAAVAGVEASAVTATAEATAVEQDYPSESGETGEGADGGGGEGDDDDDDDDDIEATAAAATATAAASVLWTMLIAAFCAFCTFCAF